MNPDRLEDLILYTTILRSIRWISIVSLPVQRHTLKSRFLGSQMIELKTLRFFKN